MSKTLWRTLTIAAVVATIAIGGGFFYHRHLEAVIAHEVAEALQGVDFRFDPDIWK